MKQHIYEGKDFKVVYIRISELPEEEREPFSKWMAGQTRPVIPELEPQDAVYPWDYENWLNYKSGKPWFFD